MKHGESRMLTKQTVKPASKRVQPQMVLGVRQPRPAPWQPTPSGPLHRRPRLQAFSRQQEPVPTPPSRQQRPKVVRTAARQQRSIVSEPPCSNLSKSGGVSAAQNAIATSEEAMGNSRRSCQSSSAAAGTRQPVDDFDFEGWQRNAELPCCGTLRRVAKPKGGAVMTGMLM